MDAEETEFMDEVLSLPLICVVTEVSHAVAMRARRPKGITIRLSVLTLHN